TDSQCDQLTDSSKQPRLHSSNSAKSRGGSTVRNLAKVSTSLLHSSPRDVARKHPTCGPVFYSNSRRGPAPGPRECLPTAGFFNPWNASSKPPSAPPSEDPRPPFRKESRVRKDTRAKRFHIPQRACESQRGP